MVNTAQIYIGALTRMVYVYTPEIIIELPSKVLEANVGALMLPEVRRQWLWYAFGVVIRFAAAAPFLQDIVTTPSRGFFAVYSLFLLCVLPVMAWAYAVSFLVQLLLADGRRPVRLVLAVIVLIFSVSPYAHDAPLAMAYFGTLLSTPGLALMEKGAVSEAVGGAWAFVGTPLLMAVLFALLLFVITRVTVHQAQRTFFGLHLRGALAALVIIMILLPGVFVLLPQAYGRWFVVVLAILAPFFPHQMWMWREIKERWVGSGIQIGRAGLACL